MIFVCVVIVVAAVDPQLQAIYAQEAARRAAAIDDMDRTSFHATCSCGWHSSGYTTPGRAKMGLRAHQQRRKCEGRA